MDNTDLSFKGCDTLQRIDDGAMFFRNEDGTYTMEGQKEAMPTTYYSYSFKQLMDTGAFRVFNKPVFPQE